MKLMNWKMNWRKPMDKIFNLMKFIEMLGIEISITFYSDGSGKINTATTSMLFVDVMECELKLKEIGGLQ